MFGVFVAAFAILSLAYTYTICIMLNTLKMLDVESLESQKSSVKNQFLVFFLGFITKMLYYSYAIYFQGY